MDFWIDTKEALEILDAFFKYTGDNNEFIECYRNIYWVMRQIDYPEYPINKEDTKNYRYRFGGTELCICKDDTIKTVVCIINKNKLYSWYKRNSDKVSSDLSNIVADNLLAIRLASNSDIKMIYELLSTLELEVPYNEFRNYAINLNFIPNSIGIFDAIWDDNMFCIFSSDADTFCTKLKDIIVSFTSSIKNLQYISICASSKFELTVIELSNRQYIVLLYGNPVYVPNFIQCEPIQIDLFKRRHILGGYKLDFIEKKV